MKLENARGQSLVTVLIAAALVAMIVVALSQVLTQGFRGQKLVELRSEKTQLIDTIADSIDCNATFAAAGIDPAAPGASCTSTSTNQTPPYLPLKRVTLNGTVLDLLGSTAAPDGSRQLGKWRVRASCSAAEQSLIVLAIPTTVANGGAQQWQAPYAGTSWTDPKALVFGGSAEALPLCFGRMRNGNRWEHGFTYVPMYIGPLGTMPPTTFVVPTPSKAISASCATAAYGYYMQSPNPHERNCICANTNVAISATKVTFNVASQQSMAFSAPPPGSPSVVMSQTRGTISGGVPLGADYCYFNWSILYDR